MKKITLFIASIFIAISVAHADNNSLNDKIKLALNDGYSLKEIAYNFAEEYGMNHVLGALSQAVPQAMQASVMSLAREASPSFAPILASLQNVDSREIRHAKPTHEEVATARDNAHNTEVSNTEVSNTEVSNTEVAHNNDQNTFNPNSLPSTASGGDSFDPNSLTPTESGGDVIELASFNDPNSGELVTVSP